MNKSNVCLICGNKFSRQSNVNRHVMEVHKKPYRQVVGYGLNDHSTYQCLEGCTISFKYNQDLIYHLKDVHNIDIEMVEMEFPNFEEFKSWLDTEEIRYGVQFVRLTGWKKSFKHEKLYFECARSGKQPTNEDKPTFRRGRKSFKLNRNCTSKIIITKDTKTNIHYVKYYRTHYGHSVDDNNKRIPSKQREEIATNIKLGLSPSRILELEAEYDDSLHRKKLNRKDINNVKRSLKSKEEVENEIVSHDNSEINDLIILVEEVDPVRESLLKQIETTALQIVTASESYDNQSLALLLNNLKTIAATYIPCKGEVDGHTEKNHNYPYYYNYSYQSYPQWTSPPFELQAPPPPRNKLQEQVNIEAISSQHCVQQQEPQHHILPKIEINNNCDKNNLLPVETVTMHYVQQPETPGCYPQHCTPCTPIEVYTPMSPIVQVPQIPPGASIIYTAPPPPCQPQEMTEVLTPVLYTPPIEVPYMQSPPFIYPPTPPPSWPYTAQGFIFPPRP